MKRLVELRKERNISQTELAEMLHISQQAICKYELGQSEPDIYTLKGMANIFHTTIDYLVGHDSNTLIDVGNTLIVDNRPVTRMEIEHLISYRKLDPLEQKHIDAIICDLNEK